MIEWENYFCNDPPERLSQSLAGSPSPCNICTEGKPGPGLNWAKMKANKVRSREHDRNPTQGTKQGLKCCLSTRKESLGTRTVYGCYCHAADQKGGDVRKRVQIYFWFQLIGKCILPLHLLVKSKRQPMVNIRVTWDAHTNSRLGQLWCSDQLEATHPSIFHPRSCFLEVDQMVPPAPL